MKATTVFLVLLVILLVFTLAELMLSIWLCLDEPSTLAVALLLTKILCSAWYSYALYIAASYSKALECGDSDISSSDSVVSLDAIQVHVASGDVNMAQQFAACQSVTIVQGEPVLPHVQDTTTKPHSPLPANGYQDTPIWAKPVQSATPK